MEGKVFFSENRTLCMDVIADAFHVEGDAGKSTAEPIGEEEETIVDDGEKNSMLSKEYPSSWASWF